MSEKIPHICDGLTVDMDTSKYVMSAGATTKQLYGNMAYTVDALNTTSLILYAASLNPDVGVNLERCKHENDFNLNYHDNLKIANWVFVDVGWLESANLSIEMFQQQLYKIPFLKVGVINIETYGSSLANMRNMTLNDVYNKIHESLPRLDITPYDVAYIWGIRMNICTPELFLAKRIVNIKPPM